MSGAACKIILCSIPPQAKLNAVQKLAETKMISPRYSDRIIKHLEVIEDAVNDLEKTCIEMTEAWTG